MNIATADRIIVDGADAQAAMLNGEKIWPPDTDVNNFLTAAGLMGDSVIDPAIRSLVARLKAKGLWSLMSSIYPIVGGTAASHKFNLKDPRDLDAASRLTYHGTITHNASGMKGDGTSGWADTHWVPSAHMTPTDASMGFYTNLSTIFIKQYDMGASDAASTSAYMISAYFSTTNKSIAAMGNTALLNQFAPGADSTGMFIANRPDATHVNLWRNGVLLGSGTDPGNACNTPVALMAINVNGTAARWSILPHCFAYVGRTLTSQQVADLTVINLAFQTSLGRAA
jgi:hypothetical protein